MIPGLRRQDPILSNKCSPLQKRPRNSQLPKSNSRLPDSICSAHQNTACRLSENACGLLFRITRNSLHARSLEVLILVLWSIHQRYPLVRSVNVHVQLGLFTLQEVWLPMPRDVGILQVNMSKVIDVSFGGIDVEDKIWSALTKTAIKASV